ncbi:MarR family transcriptional regulator, partial [Vibrio fortis]
MRLAHKRKVQAKLQKRIKAAVAKVEATPKTAKPVAEKVVAEKTVAAKPAVE